MSGAKPDTWMPLYIGDYLADTMHLKRDQHGAYLLLIFAYWRRGGPLPDDDGQLAAIAKATDSEWKRSLRAVMALFFKIEGGLWHHKRVDEEIAEALRLSNRGKAGGKASAEQRANENANKTGNETSTSGELELNTLPSPSPPPSSDKNPRSQRESASDLGFDRWYEIYPKHEARGAAEQAFVKARKTASLEELIAGAERYAARADRRENGRFIALPATWLNQKRWLDEAAGEVGITGSTVPERRKPRMSAEDAEREQGLAREIH